MNSSHNQNTASVAGGSGTTKTPANSGSSGVLGGILGGSSGNSSGARRLSQEGSDKFANLEHVKRSGSSSAQGSERRTSLSEQTPKTALGSMWEKVTGR